MGIRDFGLRRIALVMVGLAIATTQSGCLFKIRDAKVALSASEINLTKFQRAQRVMKRHCASCHYQAGLTESQLVALGWAKPRDLAGSLVTARTRFGVGTANMPPDASTFSQADYQTLADWVMTMGNIQAPPGGIRFPGYPCDDRNARRPNVLRRIPKKVFGNMLQALLVDSDKGNLGSTGASIASETMNEWSNFARIPRDSDHSLNQKDRSLTSDHVEGYYLASLDIVSRLRAWNQINTFVRSFAGKNIDGSANTCQNTSTALTSCSTQFIQRFGLFIHRRPVTAAELSAYQAVYSLPGSGGLNSGYEMLIAVMLISPSFMLNAEVSNSVPGQITGISPYETASRLARLFWQSLPDQALLNAAANGSLHTDQGVFEAQLNRMLSDSRSRVMVDEFYRQLLEVDDYLREYFPGDAPFNSGLPPLGMPGWQMRQQIIQDALDFAWYQTSYFKRGYPALMQSIEAFPRNSYLAAIYRTQIWNGDFGQPQLVPLEDNRGGILGRVAFLMGNDVRNNLITRSVRIKEQFLCTNFPPPQDNSPPPEVNLQALALSTQRNIIAAMTEIPETACATCHTRGINPIGFAFELFDSLGRSRETFFQGGPYSGREIIMGWTGGGYNLMATPQINTSTEIEIFAGQRLPSASPREVAEHIVQSGLGEACFGQRFWEFAHERAPDMGLDSCMLNDAYEALTQSGGTIEDMMKAIARADEFRRQRKTGI